MEWETYQTTANVVRGSAEAIIQTSFENWPEALIDLAFQRPRFSAAVGPDELRSILANNANYRKMKDMRRPSAVPPLQPVPDDIDAVLFPKLGPVSWKEAPWLSEVCSKECPSMLAPMFRSVTDRMSLILDAFVQFSVPTFLHYFPYRDFSSVIEARMTIRDGMLARGEWISLPSNVTNLDPFKGRAIELAKVLQGSLEQRDVYIDLCVEASREPKGMRLLEINPILKINDTE